MAKKFPDPKSCFFLKSGKRLCAFFIKIYEAKVFVCFFIEKRRKIDYIITAELVGVEALLNPIAAEPLKASDEAASLFQS